MKKIVLFTILCFIVSCNDTKEKTSKKKCLSEKIDAAFIEEYLVVTDSCKTLNGYNSVSYYSNNELIMRGYSERNFKQGEWSFYNAKEEITKGLFKDSQPIGEWKFADIGNVSWKNYQDLEKGYKFSFPKEWESSAFVDGNMIGVSNSSNQSEQDFFVSITSGKIDELDLSLEEYIKNLHSTLKESKKIENFKNKRIDVEGLKDAYEFKFDTKNMGVSLSTSELIYISSDKIHVISIIIRNGSSYDYSIVKEIIMTSFKVSND
ncbi:MAG: hypothetical protein HWD85_13130 [Flavobacteriaceae bacterium]|nr:hypothetical protein [Flavobacteriaceae bacterium]